MTRFTCSLGKTSKEAVEARCSMGGFVFICSWAMEGFPNQVSSSRLVRKGLSITLTLGLGSTLVVLASMISAFEMSENAE